MSKGSRRRPLSIPREEYEERWQEIFGKSKEKQDPPEPIYLSEEPPGEEKSEEESWDIVYEDDDDDKAEEFVARRTFRDGKLHSVNGKPVKNKNDKKKKNKRWKKSKEDKEDPGLKFYCECREAIEKVLGRKVDMIPTMGSAHVSLRDAADEVVLDCAKRKGARLPSKTELREYVGYGFWKVQYVPGLSLHPFPKPEKEFPETD